MLLLWELGGLRFTDQDSSQWHHCRYVEVLFLAHRYVCAHNMKNEFLFICLFYYCEEVFLPHASLAQEWYKAPVKKYLLRRRNCDAFLKTTVEDIAELVFIFIIIGQFGFCCAPHSFRGEIFFFRFSCSPSCCSQDDEAIDVERTAKVYSTSNDILPCINLMSKHETELTSHDAAKLVVDVFPLFYSSNDHDWGKLRS